MPKQFQGLPPTTDPRSPALSGMPESITGQGGMGAALTGNMPSTQGAALAPASPPGGAQVGGAPLSSNGASERQGGVGANFDLVKDRGSPEEYWGNNIKMLGSKTALMLMSDAAIGSSGKTGQMAQMDPEEVRRIGTRMNEAMGIGTPEQQDKIVESMVYKPMQKSIQTEVEKGVIGEDEGVMRMAIAMAQIEGADDENDLANLLAYARTAIAAGKIAAKAGNKYPQRSESGGAVRGKIPPPGESRGTDFETGIQSYSAEKPLLQRKFIEQKQRKQ